MSLRLHTTSTSVTGHVGVAKSNYQQKLVVFLKFCFEMSSGNRVKVCIVTGVMSLHALTFIILLWSLDMKRNLNFYRLSPLNSRTFQAKWAWQVYIHSIIVTQGC